MISHEMNGMFYGLQAVTVMAAVLTGSSWQWVVQNGGVYGHNQYNKIVTVAAGSSLIQTVTCFINALMYPNNSMWFMIFILVNWVVMTHSSVMLVSRKLALTYINSDHVWKRLLLINLFMFPISVFTCVYWTVAYNKESEVFPKINRIMEPIQITLWGIIEFCLSGAFIVQMWKFSWTQVERRGIYVLVLVAICDCMSVLTNVLVGDLPSTSIKGFVYCVRIRLEVSVLCQMVEFVKSKRGSVTFGSANEYSAATSANLHSNKKNRRSSWTSWLGWNQHDSSQLPSLETFERSPSTRPMDDSHPTVISHDASDEPACSLSHHHDHDENEEPTTTTKVDTQIHDEESPLPPQQISHDNIEMSPSSADSSCKRWDEEADESDMPVSPPNWT